jgi:hypothetical protein
MSKTEGRIPAAVAWKVVERLRERLASTCTQFEIAGSLRRQKPTVGDVDIVCVPILEEPPGMLPGLGHAEPVAFLREVDAIVTGSNGAITYEVNGEAIKRLIIRLKDGTRITADIYFTRDPEQFPTLLIRICVNTTRMINACVLACSAAACCSCARLGAWTINPTSVWETIVVPNGGLEWVCRMGVVPSVERLRCIANRAESLPMMLQ